MGLTGIEIYKMLPQTNCKDCGVPTCLAFAMKLAAGQAELDSCPHVSDEAKEKLSSASAPPVLPVTVGAGEAAFQSVVERQAKIASVQRHVAANQAQGLVQGDEFAVIAQLIDLGSETGFLVIENVMIEREAQGIAALSDIRTDTQQAQRGRAGKVAQPCLRRG